MSEKLGQKDLSSCQSWQHQLFKEHSRGSTLVSFTKAKVLDY
jgi:hypothetical protein